jgi:hypothetical protein
VQLDRTKTCEEKKIELPASRKTAANARTLLPGIHRTWHAKGVNELQSASSDITCFNS